MFSALAVAVLFALGYSSSSVMGQDDCICHPYNGNLDDRICEDPSLTAVPDCVRSDIPILSINTASIPLVPETIKRFTSLRRLSIVTVNCPVISTNFLLHQTHLPEFNVWVSNLDYVDGRWFKYTPNLVRVSFDVNNLTSLAEDTFRFAPNLYHLTLKSNSLTTLPGSIFEGTSLKYLSLYNNPWYCDCEFMGLVQWLKNHGVEMLDETFCKYPLDLRGLNIMDLTEEIACSN